MIFTGRYAAPSRSAGDTMYAFTRTARLDFAGLAKAEIHGRGDDVSSRKRRRPDATQRALAVALDDKGRYIDQDGDDLFADKDAPDEGEGEGEGKDEGTDRFDPYAIKAAFKRHKERQGAAEKKGVRPVMHVVVGVSPEWLGAGVHDPASPRVRRLLESAVQWANAELGGVFSARYDVDERGGGVVDVFCAPVREYAVGRGRTMRRMVAPAMALRELAKRRDRGLSYRAMQDSWTEWANRELGDGVRFQRGRPKAQTRAEHLSPEDYRRSLDIAAERERDGPCRQFVDRIAEICGDDGDDDRYRRLALWLNLERERFLGEPLDPERVVADIDLLADGEIDEDELQAITRELEGRLARRARGDRGAFADVVRRLGPLRR